MAFGVDPRKDPTHSPVRDMRPTKVMTVEPATPLKEIVARLAEHRVSTVPVVNDAGRRRATS